MNVNLALKNSDIVCDYIPVVSTVSNVVDLFIKYVVIPQLKPETIAKNRYFTHLCDKEAWRCVVLLVPILGNIWIFICDYLKSRKTQPEVSQQVTPLLHLEASSVALRNQEQVKIAVQVLQDLEKRESIGTSTIELEGKLVTIEYSKTQGGKVLQAKFAIDGQSYQVYRFLEGAYQGPKTQDFHDRQQLLTAAAVRYLARNRGESLKDKVSALETHYKNCVEKECQVDLEVMKQGGEEAEKHYSTNREHAVELSAQYICDLQAVISKAFPSFTVDDLKREEIEAVIERGRPVLIHLYEAAPLNKADAKRQMVSIQDPAARVYGEDGCITRGQTLPSMARDRQGLANYVTATFGELKEGGLSILFQGVRHCSYPAIRIENTKERQAIAGLNCQQMIVDATVARHGLEALLKTSQERPLVVPIRVMMLLTAKVGDSIRNRSFGLTGTWIGDSETLQLEESAAALNRFHDQTVTLTVAGKEVYIRPNISLMNLGINAEAAGIGLKGMAPTPPIQTEMNERGFCDFDEESTQFLLKWLNDIHDPELLETFSKYQQIFVHPTIQNARNLYAAKAKIYKKNQKAIQEIQTAVKQRFERLPSDCCAFFLNHLQALDLFYNEKYKKKETLMDFQAIYLQQHNRMGNFIDFFCKSAEDRTGRLNNVIEEREIFRLLTGRYPTSEEEKALINKLWALPVHQFSASYEATKANSEAPGLQVGDNVNPEEIQASIQKTSALSTKEAFNMAKKLKPSVLASREIY